MGGWPAGPGDEYEGEVADGGGHVHSENRAKLRSWNSQEFPARGEGGGS